MIREEKIIALRMRLKDDSRSVFLDCLGRVPSDDIRDDDGVMIYAGTHVCSGFGLERIDHDGTFVGWIDFYPVRSFATLTPAQIYGETKFGPILEPIRAFIPKADS